MINLAPKTKKTLELAGKILLILIVVGSLAWFFIINPYLIRQEKQRFESAAAELEKLSQDINGKLNSDAEMISNHSCGRANLKSEEGPLSCNVSFYSIHKAVDVNEANQILMTVSSLNSNPLRKGPLSDGVTFVEPSNSLPQIIYQSIGEIHGLSCAHSYEYRPYESSIKITQNCGGSAIAEHYPVED
jgi:hypothetical protein